jgi:hypothetical protein
MSIDIDVLFKGMKEAPMGRPKTYLDYGKYLVELTEMFVKNSEKDGLPVFICRFTILESNNPKHPPNSEGSWTLKGKPLQYGQGDIKALVLAILGVDPRTVKEGDAENHLASLLFRWILGSESAKAEVAAMPEQTRPDPDFYVGTRVRLETKPKSPEKPFTRHFWTPA